MARTCNSHYTIPADSGKCLGIECWFELTGDKAADMAFIRDYYADKSPLYAGQASPVRFREH